MSIPFTYYIFHKPTGKKYYGVRFKNGCHPNDLWDKYFTSSKIVHRLIEQYGAKSFDVEIRKTFPDKQSAIDWEQKVLQRMNVMNRSDWLNQSHGYAISNSVSFGMLGKTHSEETLKKMSAKQAGENNPMFGKTHSDEIKAKIAEASKNRKVSEETKQRLSEIKKGKPFSGHGGQDPDVRKRAAETMRGQKRSEESKERMRQAQLGKKRSPEAIAKFKASMAARKAV